MRLHIGFASYNVEPYSRKWLLLHLGAYQIFFSLESSAFTLDFCGSGVVLLSVICRERQDVP